jgi:DNA mismatch endonuclease, patch repair protein
VEVRHRLWKMGFRYRLHDRRVIGRPDLAFGGSRVAVFIDGCFWHGCPEHRVWPQTRSTFWRKKLEGNVHRDRFVGRELERQGWAVVRIWEHEIEDSPERATGRIRRAVQARGSERLQRR